jgi:hypothetical protein
MRQLAFAFAVAAMVGGVAASCGDEVNTNGNAGGGGSDGGAGGMGGEPVSSTSSASGGTGGGEMTCDDGNFPNLCEEACCKVEVECELAGACGLAFAQLGIQCGDPEAECVGEVLLRESTTCPDIISLATGDADPQLQSDLLGCINDDPCLECGINNCTTEATDCQGVQACQDFIQCVTSMGCNDQGCIDQCEMDNASTETSALVTCLEANCVNECLSGGGGAGGAGGAGGGGGAGGAGGAGGN